MTLGSFWPMATVRVSYCASQGRSWSSSSIPHSRGFLAVEGLNRLGFRARRRRTTAVVALISARAHGREVQQLPSNFQGTPKGNSQALSNIRKVSINSCRPGHIDSTCSSQSNPSAAEGFPVLCDRAIRALLPSPTSPSHPKPEPEALHQRRGVQLAQTGPKPQLNSAFSIEHDKSMRYLSKATHTQHLDNCV